MGTFRLAPLLQLSTTCVHLFALYLLICRLSQYISPLTGISDALADLSALHLTAGHEAERVLREATAGKDDVRIYVYNLPPKYNRLQVERSRVRPSPIRDPYCDSNFYSAEVKVHHGLLRSSARVTDPEHADFFYVPIYVTCYLLNNHPNNLTKTGLFFEEAMTHVRSHWPYFNTSQGRDHVYTFAQGFGARLAGTHWRAIRNGVFLVHNGDFASDYGEYTPRKDIVIPPALDAYLTPVYIDSDADTRVLERRANMAMFGGQAFSNSISDHRGFNYSSGVRQYLAKHANDHLGFLISGVRADDYLDNMRASLFCLAPEGWHPWSPRPYYGILLGCVPVVLSERQELAFEDVLPYDRLVVHMRPGDVADVNDVLRGIDVEDVLHRIRLMERIWPLFWYVGPRAMALDGILAELARRKYKVRPKRVYRTGPERVTLQ